MSGFSAAAPGRTMPEAVFFFSFETLDNYTVVQGTNSHENFS
jgi:hypothetical protein